MELIVILASKADRRLVLFYLANDVLQNSRKKGKEFSNAFTKILREAMPLLRFVLLSGRVVLFPCCTFALYLNFTFILTFSDKNIKGSIQRVIKIWEERKLFESDYLEALRSKLGRD